MVWQNRWAMTDRSKLNDGEWLADRYASASLGTIARELGVAPETVRRAMRRHGIEVRDRSSGQKFRAAPELHDPDWLREQYAAGQTGAQIAALLGVSLAAVHHAMARHGIETDGSWVRRDTTRLQRPPKRAIERLWNRHGTIKGVARELGAAHTTTAVWLADVGVFLHDVPAISRRDIERHIDAGRTIAEIAAAHRVADRTVMIELRRHGLVDAHRLRPSISRIRPRRITQAVDGGAPDRHLRDGHRLR